MMPTTPRARECSRLISRALRLPVTLLEAAPLLALLTLAAGAADPAPASANTGKMNFMFILARPISRHLLERAGAPLPCATTSVKPGRMRVVGLVVCVRSALGARFHPAHARMQSQADDWASLQPAARRKPAILCNPQPAKQSPCFEPHALSRHSRHASTPTRV